MDVVEADIVVSLKTKASELQVSLYHAPGPSFRIRRHMTLARHGGRPGPDGGLGAAHLSAGRVGGLDACLTATVRVTYCSCSNSEGTMMDLPGLQATVQSLRIR